MSSRRACSGVGVLTARTFSGSTRSVRSYRRSKFRRRAVVTSPIQNSHSRISLPWLQPHQLPLDFRESASSLAPSGPRSRICSSAAVDQRLVRGRVSAQPLPGALAVARPLHAPAEKRIELHRQQRSFVAPVLEQRSVAVVGRAFEQLRSRTSHSAKRPAGNASGPARSPNRSALRRAGARSCQRSRHPSGDATSGTNRLRRQRDPPGFCER